MKRAFLDKFVTRVEELEKKDGEIRLLLRCSANDHFAWTHLLPISTQIGQLRQTLMKLSKEDDESVKAIELELTKLEKEIKEFHKIVDSSKKQINKLLKDRLKLNDFQIARRKEQATADRKPEVGGEKENRFDRRFSWDNSIDKENLKRIWIAAACDRSGDTPPECEIESDPNELELPTPPSEPLPVTKPTGSILQPRNSTKRDNSGSIWNPILNLNNNHISAGDKW